MLLERWNLQLQSVELRALCSNDDGLMENFLMTNTTKKKTDYYTNKQTMSLYTQKNPTLCVFPQTPAEGAATVLYTALSPALEGELGGGYWADGCKEMTSPPTFDPELQLSLWESSLQLLGLRWHQMKE